MQKRRKVPVYCRQPLVSRDCVHAVGSTVEDELGLPNIDVSLVQCHNTV